MATHWPWAPISQADGKRVQSRVDRKQYVPKCLLKTSINGTRIQTEHNGKRYAAQKPISFSRYVDATRDRLAIFVNLQSKLVLSDANSAVISLTSMRYCICIALSGLDRR